MYTCFKLKLHSHETTKHSTLSFILGKRQTRFPMTVPAETFYTGRSMYLHSLLQKYTKTYILLSVEIEKYMQTNPE